MIAVKNGNSRTEQEDHLPALNAALRIFTELQKTEDADEGREVPNAEIRGGLTREVIPHEYRQDPPC